jgi:hypothetical protein
MPSKTRKVKHEISMFGITDCHKPKKIQNAIMRIGFEKLMQNPKHLKIIRTENSKLLFYFRTI